MSGGSIIPAVGTITTFSVNQQGGCLTDIFTITNQNTVPNLCSTLSGDHGKIFYKSSQIFLNLRICILCWQASYLNVFYVLDTHTSAGQAGP